MKNFSSNQFETIDLFSKYKSQLSEIFRFVLPMLISALSINIMILVDRLVLTRYSFNAVNAVSVGGFFVTTCAFIWICIAQIASVFVGQFNGSKNYKKTSWPTWQMVYLALFSILFFVPLSLIVENFNLIPESFRLEGLPYQKILLMGVPVQILLMAMTTFFIGRKEGITVTAIMLFGNLINFLLDILFVFGYGKFPSLGAKGAAMATISSQVIQVIIFGIIFFNHKNRTENNTTDCAFRYDLFKQCISVGLPFSFGKFLNMVAWYVVLVLFSFASNELAILISAEFMILVIFSFFANGMEGAVSSMVSNLIGGNNSKEVPVILKLFIALNFIVAICFSFPLVFKNSLMFDFLNLSSVEISRLHGELEFLMKSVWFIVVGDGLYYTVAGILVAGGDTKYPMYLELIFAWGLAVLPTAILFYTGHLDSVKIVYTIIPAGGFLKFFLIYRRYKENIWCEKLV